MIYGVLVASWEVRQEALLARLRRQGRAGLETGTMVVVPSLTFSMAELEKIAAVVHYEERLLFMTMLLRNPELRMVFVTSLAVDPAIIDYYLRFVPDADDARRRLELVSLGDPGIRPLTRKLLDRPDALARITSLADEDAYLVTFNVMPEERSLSEALGLPLFGPPPDLSWLGSKTGSRRIARQAGARVLEGSEDHWDLGSLALATERIRAHAPHARAVVIKLNNGFAGQGNAIVELEGPVRPLTEARTSFCATSESWPSFEAKISADGAIVEELVRNEEMVSPSVQLRIVPGSDVEVVSTHDQILTGPQGQVYFGCRFPADPGYRLVIQDAALKVARALAVKGVIGSFGIDFLVAPGRRGNDVYVSEINLRMGGTTHPFWMACLATGGTYDVASGELLARTGPKRYMATDNLTSARLIGRTPAEVIEAIERSGLAYDQATQTGALPHMLGAVPTYGKMGVTCVAGTLEEADAIYQAVVIAITEFGR